MTLDELVYDPGDPAILRNPHQVFARLREEDPVHWSEPMSGWIVSTYDDITEGLTDGRTFSAERLTNVRKHLPAPAMASAEEVLRYLSSWMVFRDAPDHTRLRRHMAAVLNLPVFEITARHHRKPQRGIAGHPPGRRAFRYAAPLLDPAAGHGGDGADGRRSQPPARGQGLVGRHDAVHRQRPRRA
ncbi:hypothetical protein ACFSTD_19445 [Novosphingobium colocasiae]